MPPTTDRSLSVQHHDSIRTELCMIFRSVPQAKMEQDVEFRNAIPSSRFLDVMEQVEHAVFPDTSNRGGRSNEDQTLGTSPMPSNHAISYCDEVNVFQAAPLVWRDSDGMLHPIVPLDFDQEREMLSDALKDASLAGEINLVFEFATIDRLGAFLAASASSMGRPRVLHYSGHGTSDYVCVEDESGGAQFLGVRDLREFVSVGDGGEKSSLLLVFIAACHSRAAGEAFLRAGASHVVCCRIDEPLADSAGA